MSDVSNGVLLQQHQRLLDGSAISPEIAKVRGYRSVSTKAHLKELGFGQGQARVPALLIPVWGVTGEIVLYQARPDQPRIVNGKSIKYETPSGARMALDVPPAVRESLRDPARPLFITEGVRKADAAVSKGLNCVALLGVWNWRGTNGAGGKTVLPDWEHIALNDRQVYVAFDSDVMEKEAVHAALARLKAFLEHRGGKVKLIYLPPGPGGEKVGLDDYLAAGHTVDDLMALATTTLREPPGSVGESQNAGPYRVEDRSICFVKQTADGPVSTPLCNFSAQVKEELILDDGCETTRAFVIEGHLASGKSLAAVRVPADRFASMSWVTSQWGLEAIVHAGFATKDRLREAIQRLSPGAVRRRVFTHTGWRCVEGVWRYLTAAGAVGAEGFEVDLGSDLARYSLPRSPEDSVGAMRASLDLLRTAPLTVTAPLWAGVFRAPLASTLPLDLSIWMEGATGSLKSTLAALFLCHCGTFDRTALPGAWSSTANSLEKRAFVLKDIMFVIDDFAPSPLDRREQETKAARILRAQGNLSGRSRLRSDLTERPGYPPRGLIVGTGEQLPPGHSIRARLLTIEVNRDDINLTVLSTAQSTTARLPHAMAGYIAWLAPQMGTITASLRETFESTRRRALENAPHLRVPEAMAHLWIGLDCALAYAEEIGACDAARGRDLRDECYEALRQRAEAQGQGLEEEKPARRFLTILVTLVQQQRALLLPRDSSGTPDRRDPPLIGWYDSECLYLKPDAAFQAVSRFAREADEPFAVNQRRLGQDLVRDGIAISGVGHSTTTVRIGGTVQRVLRLRNVAIEALIGEELPFVESAETGVTAVTGFTE